MKRSASILLLLAVASAGLLSGCDRKTSKEKPVERPAALITTTTAQTRDVEVTEQSVGTLEGLVDPTVGAEVAARVVQVHAHAGQTVHQGQLIAVLDAQDFALQQREAQAEIARIEALLANQGKVVERHRRLVLKNFISQNALDDVTTQQAALAEQLEAARARLATVEHVRSKARVLSPLDGRVEKQVVSVGDFVRVGDPLFQIIGTQKLRAHLPFPENVAARLKPGQTLVLSSPAAPDRPITTRVGEIKPLIGSANRAADVIADVAGGSGWYPGSSVNGTVVLEVRRQAVIVPEQSLVLRPAGDVVYVLERNVARQRIVKPGLRTQGLVEILEGLAAGEPVAMDGAAFLTDKAQVKVKATR